jgi:hypothetical protein
MRRQLDEAGDQIEGFLKKLHPTWRVLRYRETLDAFETLTARRKLDDNAH